MITKIVSDPGILGGSPVFEGTRVPVSIIVEEMSRGKFDVEHYRQHYPTLTPEHIAMAIRLTIAVGRWPKGLKQPKLPENANLSERLGVQPTVKKKTKSRKRRFLRRTLE